MPRRFCGEGTRATALGVADRQCDLQRQGGGPLKNPHNDAAAVGRALEAVGFKITVVRDASRRDVLSEVRAFAERLAQEGPEAIGFFYYSGHGISRPEDRANYLIPVDLRDTESSDFWFDAVKLDDILAELERVAPSAAHFVVFDACRNELKLPVKSVAKLGFSPVTERAGMYIAFATAPGAVASDQGATSGPYAGALAAELTRPGQDHLQLFQNVKEGVYSTTGNRQLPWASDGMVKRIYLSGLPAPDRPGLRRQPQHRSLPLRRRRPRRAKPRASGRASTRPMRGAGDVPAPPRREPGGRLRSRAIGGVEGEDASSRRPWSCVRRESQGTCGSKPNEANLDAFIKGCNELIARNPRHETAYFSRGRAYLGRWPNTTPPCRTSTARSRSARAWPRPTRPWRGLRPQEAVRPRHPRVQPVDRHQARRPRPTTTWGWPIARQGQSDRALPHFNKAIEIDPHYARAYANRGDIYLQQGNRNRAMAEYRQALALDPTYGRVRRALEGFGVKR